MIHFLLNVAGFKLHTLVYFICNPDDWMFVLIKQDCAGQKSKSGRRRFLTRVLWKVASIEQAVAGKTGIYISYVPVTSPYVYIYSFIS